MYFTMATRVLYRNRSCIALISIKRSKPGGLFMYSYIYEIKYLVNSSEKNYVRANTGISVDELVLS